MNQEQRIARSRIAIGLFIIGLVASGVTAFPLEWELKILSGFFAEDDQSGLAQWIHRVRDGLVETNKKYPFMSYGTDWLAYGHIIIALFFLEPFRNPLQNRWVLKMGLVACVGIFPLAFIAGTMRQIPFYWQLIDCSFGVFGSIPLLYALHLTKKPVSVT